MKRSDSSPPSGGSPRRAASSAAGAKKVSNSLSRRSLFKNDLFEWQSHRTVQQVQGEPVRNEVVTRAAAVVCLRYWLRGYALLCGLADDAVDGARMD